MKRAGHKTGRRPNLRGHGQMVAKVEEKRYYHWSGRTFSPERFAYQLAGLIQDVKIRTGKTRVIYLCIGSDRSTGDSLGPLVGHQLCRMAPDEALVMGTLKKPVHAVNLKTTMDVIRRCYSDCLVVAVDASVGSEEQVGGITLGLGAIRPGLGVCKKLQEVGDIYITGVVHGGRNPEPEILQSTRLALVMELAECICSGIFASAEFPTAAGFAGRTAASRVETFYHDHATV